MTQYDNEFFRGPPEELPTLAKDHRPTGEDLFRAGAERTTAAADVSVTREALPKDPPKKKSGVRRITKAIKLLASCMAAVVITEAATNIAATVEVPEEVPTGRYYVGQWPGVEPSHQGVYRMDLESELGYSIQIPVGGSIWRLTADTDWRLCWLEGDGYTSYIELHHRQTGVSVMAELMPQPHSADDPADSCTTLVTPTGEKIYVRAFFLSLGQYEEEYGLSEEMLAASAEFRQHLVHEIFAGIRVTAGTENGWQALEIGEKLYVQQGPEWYGLGGFGDPEIHIPWVNYAADYNLQNMTPYARKNINGITWSIYFAENDTYLWAVPNVDPEICLGGLTARFMCADAVRRGEYINDDEWLQMGGFTSASQRRTAVDVLVECLEHHYALRERWYPREWPWKGATDTASYWVWAESVRGTWIQFSFGDEACRVDSSDPELRFHWERTAPAGDKAVAELEISRMVQNEEKYAIDLAVCRTPFADEHESCAYETVQTTGGDTLYLEFRSQYSGNGPEFSSAEMEAMADQIMGSVTFVSAPDDRGWSRMLLCDTMHSPQTMEWSGSGIVGSRNEIRYIHPVEVEDLEYETLCGVRTSNGITWTFYYEEDEIEDEKIIWAVPDIEPGVCIGAMAENARDDYRATHPSWADDGWNSQYNVPADVIHAVEGFAEALSHIYPLGVEPEAS